MAEAYRLIVMRHGLILDEVEIDGPSLTAGREEDSDLVLDDASVSRKVAIFELDGERLRVRDAGSLVGLIVNGQPADEADLQRGDVVEAGPFMLEVGGGPEPVARPPEPTSGDTLSPRETHPSVERPRRAVGVVRHPDDATEAPLLALRPRGADRIELAEGTHVVGRDPACRVALVTGAVSKRHAEIEVSADAVTLRDLGSTNGTFVNGSRITSQQIFDGDQLRFGDVETLAEALADSLRRDSHAGATVLTMGPAGSAEPAVTPANQTILTGAALLEQSHSVGPDDPGDASGGGNKLRRILLLALLVVVVAVFAMMILSSPAEREEAIDTPAPPPVAAMPTAPVVDAADLYQRGRMELQQDHIESAAILWQQAIEADPTVPGLVEAYGDLLFKIGYVYEGDGRYDTARQTWERLVEVLAQFPEDPNVIRSRVRLRRLEAPR
jgi:pSer/pThr/pTyr-binding forkhead associated (FHA) protein